MSAAQLETPTLERSDRTLEQHRQRLAQCGSTAGGWDIFRGVCRQDGAEAAFRLIGEEWDRFGSTGPLLELVREAYLDGALMTSIRHWAMTQEERTLYFAFPELIRVWSFTTSKAKSPSWYALRADAVRLARRGGKGVVMCAVARSRDVFGVKRTRSGTELIVFPRGFIGRPTVKELRPI